MLYVNNLDVTQSRQANDSASIAKRAKQKILQLRKLEKVQQEAKCHNYRKSLRV